MRYRWWLLLLAAWAVGQTIFVLLVVPAVYDGAKSTFWTIYYLTTIALTVIVAVVILVRLRFVKRVLKPS